MARVIVRIAAGTPAAAVKWQTERYERNTVFVPVPVRVFAAQKCPLGADSLIFFVTYKVHLGR